jgi:hypothetical protein
MNERDPKNTTTSLACKKKKQKRSFKRKNAKSHSSLFFFRSKFLFREKHTTEEEENFVVREISLQTNKQHKQTTQAKRGRTKERREQNARKSWPPLSPPLRFWCSPFRRRLRLVGERGGEGAKEAPIIIR